MTRWKMLTMVSIAIVMVTSIAGQPQLGGLLAACGLLLAILFFLVEGSRPGVRTNRPRRARRPSQLGRSRPPDTPRSLAGITVAVAAAWEVIEHFGVPAPGTLATMLFVFAVLYAVGARVMAPWVGIAGTVASVLALVSADECGVTPSRQAYVVIGVAAVVAMITFGVARLGALPLGSPLPRRRDAGTWALVLFGAVEVAVFALMPNGIEIWDGAPVLAEGGAVLLFAGIALFAAFGVELILGLLAVAVVFGETVLALAEEGVGPDSAVSCGRPLTGLLWMVACIVLTAGGVRLVSPGRSWSTDVRVGR